MENSKKLFQVGNSCDSENLICASFKKISNLEKDTIGLRKLKIFYERKRNVLAFQFGLIDTETNQKIKTEKEIYGSFKPETSLNFIEEITLTLEKGEEIYVINGFFNKNRIERFCVYTTFGQFIECGQHIHQCNFQWEFYYNNTLFDGFIIGCDHDSINYLAALYTDKNDLIKDNEAELDETKLKDTTHESISNRIEIINVSKIFGNFDEKTIFEDNFLKIKENNNITLSNISVYFDTKHIYAIELKYKFPNMTLNTDKTQNISTSINSTENDDSITKDFLYCSIGSEYDCKIIL